MSERDYSKLTVNLLKEELRGRGLDQTGKKADLIAKLERDDIARKQQQQELINTNQSANSFNNLPNEPQNSNFAGSEQNNLNVQNKSFDAQPQNNSCNVFSNTTNLSDINNQNNLNDPKLNNEDQVQRTETSIEVDNNAQQNQHLQETNDPPIQQQPQQSFQPLLSPQSFPQNISEQPQFPNQQPHFTQNQQPQHLQKQNQNISNQQNQLLNQDPQNQFKENEQHSEEQKMSNNNQPNSQFSHPEEQQTQLQQDIPTQGSKEPDVEEKMTEQTSEDNINKNETEKPTSSEVSSNNQDEENKIEPKETNQTDEKNVTSSSQSSPHATNTTSTPSKEQESEIPKPPVIDPENDKKITENFCIEMRRDVDAFQLKWFGKRFTVPFIGEIVHDLAHELSERSFQIKHLDKSDVKDSRMQELMERSIKFSMEFLSNPLDDSHTQGVGKFTFKTKEECIKYKETIQQIKSNLETVKVKFNDQLEHQYLNRDLSFYKGSILDRLLYVGNLPHKPPKKEEPEEEKKSTEEEKKENNKDEEKTEISNEIEKKEDQNKPDEKPKEEKKEEEEETVSEEEVNEELKRLFPNSLKLITTHAKDNDVARYVYLEFPSSEEVVEAAEKHKQLSFHGRKLFIIKALCIKKERFGLLTDTLRSIFIDKIHKMRRIQKNPWNKSKQELQEIGKAITNMMEKLTQDSKHRKGWGMELGSLDENRVEKEEPIKEQPNYRGSRNSQENRNSRSNASLNRSYDSRRSSSHSQQRYGGYSYGNTGSGGSGYSSGGRSGWGGGGSASYYGSGSYMNQPYNQGYSNFNYGNQNQSSYYSSASKRKSSDSYSGDWKRGRNH